MLLPTTIHLTDATPVFVRPVAPADRELLRDGLARLSPASRYRRFMAIRDDFSERELDYLTQVDHHDHEALLAFDRTTGEGIGIARYVRVGPTTAELAITVADEWQGRGVGGRLANLVALRARAAGITSFTASTLGTNMAAISMLAALGRTQRCGFGAHVQLETRLPSRRTLRRRGHAHENASFRLSRRPGWLSGPRRARASCGTRLRGRFSRLRPPGARRRLSSEDIHLGTAPRSANGINVTYD